MKEHAAATVVPTGPYVFVCYAHDEREIVLEQINWLRSQGFEIWFDEAIEVGNSVEYGLSASIYTQDINRAFKAMREMYTGIFYVNAPTIGAETHLPFGGTKNTGNGHREACVQALEVFSEWKSIYIDFSGKLQRAQID